MMRKPQSCRAARLQRKKVAVGLSGGVDSAVGAAILQERGYQVTGVFLECWRTLGCRTEEDRKDALSVALRLGIPFKVLDFRREYKSKVVEYFYREYEAGRTPNPDTVCNGEIKFGVFYEWAVKEGFDYVATGHYARVVRVREVINSESGIPNDFQFFNSSDEEYFLVRGVDSKKDQSYFLYQLGVEQLKRILFPIGEMNKKQVRARAKKRGLLVADKPDSQGICFIGSVDVKEFIGERIKPKQGNLVWKVRNSKREILNRFKNQSLKVQNESSLEGDDIVIGRHDGAWFYTIGQRVGSGLDKKILKRLWQERIFPYDPARMPAMFVINKDVESNVLVVGFEGDVLRSKFRVADLNWLVAGFEPLVFNSGLKVNERTVYVRLRNTGRLIKAEVRGLSSRQAFPVAENWGQTEVGEGELQVVLEEPEKGVAPGQACVFYSSNLEDAVVLGGAVVV